MKITIYTLTWDAADANERVGTQLFTTKAERDQTVLEWVREWGVECASVDELDSERVIDALSDIDVEYHLHEHELEVFAA